MREAAEMTTRLLFCRKEAYAMCGIYMIKNKINENAYIGQAKDILHRWSTHRMDLNANRHVNRHLQGAWNKYTPDAFDFIVLEECAEDELDGKEQYYIDLYDTYENGYNLDRGGQGIVGFKHTDEQIEKMRKVQNPLVVLQFDFDFNLINKFVGGVSHAKKALGYTKECIQRCCNHQGKQVSYKDSYWVYEQEYLHEEFSWDKYLMQIPCCEVKKEERRLNTRKIYQYDKNRNLIKIWDSFSDIEKAGFTRNQVNTICNQRKGKKTHKGYIWTYEDYDWSDGYFDNLDDAYSESIDKKKIAVLQIDHDGKCVNKYESRSEAGINMGVDSGMIGRAVLNHGVCVGYFWANEGDTWFVNNVDYLHERYDRYIGMSGKTTYKIDENGKVLYTYNSRSEAARAVGSSTSEITKAVNNHSTCRGFYWA